jgi:hypothetical protein
LSLAVVELEIFSTCGLPRREDNVHIAFDCSVEANQVVLAVAFHHNDIIVLGQGSAKLPQSAEVTSGHEFVVHIESSVGVDFRAAWAVCIRSVDLLSLTLHADNTLRDGITGAV